MGRINLLNISRDKYMYFSFKKTFNLSLLFVAQLKIVVRARIILTKLRFPLEISIFTVLQDTTLTVNMDKAMCLGAPTKAPPPPHKNKVNCT